MSIKIQKKKHNSSNIYLKDNIYDTKTLLKLSMLNELLFSNNNGLKINIKKKQSKTPSKSIKRKARTPLPFSPKERVIDSNKKTKEPKKEKIKYKTIEKEKKIENIEIKKPLIQNSEIEKKLNYFTPNNNNSKLINNLTKQNPENQISPLSKTLPKSSSVPNFKKKSKLIKKIYKIETLSQVGFSGPGIPKHNQDNFFIYKNLNDEHSTLFIGVCDGHGIFGHDVSSYLIKYLPKNLNTSLKKTNKYISHKETLYKTLKEVFISTNKNLCQSSGIDTQFSGSTCVSLILTKNKIISANAGDSRAVMGRYKNDKWESIDLSRDLKPDTPGEKERILKNGGRIEAYKDENGGDFGPKRVWLKDEDIPGLAMSRSFGDEVAASVGTISEPEIMEFDMCEDDKFIIVASDGIWEFISSQECVQFISEFYWKKDLVGCLKFLLNESSKRWIKEEEVIDDITAVIIFFEDN